MRSAKESLLDLLIKTRNRQVCIPRRRLRQEVHCKFKSHLCYTVQVRPELQDPVSKNQAKQTKKKGKKYIQ